MPGPEAAAQAGASSAADPTLLCRSLELLSGAGVELRETHCSVVFLTSTRAYKLKKPVVFDFADQRLRGARATACHRELELNERLAPGLGLGVRAVVAAPGGYALSEAQDPAAIDYLVEMRRFDEASTMRALLERGTLTPAKASAAGAAIGRFHHTAQVLVAPLDHRAVVHRNLEALLPLVADQVPDHGLLGLWRFCDAFLLAWGEVLEARVQQGKVVDGHGDLRAEHILFEGERVLEVDRLEWDELRRVDVADDLAFLLMDLESRQGADLATAVRDGYVRGGGASHPAALLAFFGAYRALVRAKVALLRVSQLPAEDADGGARRLLELSRRLSWRARGPLVLLVTGPPASGKSTLAAELGRASGLTVLASDDVRREGGDRAPGYAMAERAEVYRRLAERAQHRPAVIVDATFGEPDLQRAFLDALGTSGPLLAVECVASTEVRTARAVARDLSGGSPSDAGPTVSRMLGDRFQPMAAVAGDARMAVDTQATLELQVDAVETWLDARLAEGTGL